MKREFLKGVYPVMLTPFTADNEVDYEALGKLTDWYIEAGVAGLFAVCQSSEMFFLTLEERIQITKFVVKRAAGRVAVLSSGHISDSHEEQVNELNEIAKTGVDALIMITNRLAREDESNEIWLYNLKKLMERLPAEIPLGFYECPYPYKRVMTPKMLEWCAKTGRFYFTKDTSCDMENICAKLEAIKGSSIQLFNANTATLLESMLAGGSGYSGVMANFHPKLYVWLTKNYKEEPEKARKIADFLTTAALIERQIYPINAKYFQKKIGNFTTHNSRTKDPALLNKTDIMEIDQLLRTVEYMKNMIFK